MTPTQVLGVPREGASEDDIRAPIRKLAKELHPDLNPDNTASPPRSASRRSPRPTRSSATRRSARPSTAARSTPTASRAATPISARTQRGAGQAPAPAARPTRTSASATSSPTCSARGARAGAARGGFAVRGRDVRYTLEIDFLEAVTGAKKRVTLPGRRRARSHGAGGRRRRPGAAPQGQGRAAASAAAEAGDALVEIKRAAACAVQARRRRHPSGACPSRIDEAVLGAKVEVPTISGRVQLTIPKGTSSGRVFRLKGKGVKSAGKADSRRSARHRAHRAARHDRRQPRLLLLRVAPEEQVRPGAEVRQIRLPLSPRLWGSARPRRR